MNWGRQVADSNIGNTNFVAECRKVRARELCGIYGGGYRVVVFLC